MRLLIDGVCRIDATFKANVARFFNHSCEPNLKPIKVVINDPHLSRYHIAFFAWRDINTVCVPCVVCLTCREVRPHSCCVRRM